MADRCIHHPFAKADLYTYGYDAGSRRALPQAVVFPANSEQVAAVTRLANRRNLPLVPRGAGSGLTGGAVPANGELQKALQGYGLFYPPDPASAEFSSIGGNIAENAGGIRAVKYGVTKDYIMGLEVVLPTGETIRTGSKCIKDVVGYDLTALFVGSEGTLGTITRAVLKLLAIPEAQQTLTAFFPETAQAAKLVSTARRWGSVAAVMEFLDRDCLRALDAGQGSRMADRAQAMLLIEVDGPAGQVAREMEALLALCRDHGASDVQRAETPRERDRLWQLRRSVHANLHRLKPHWFEEDISVPVARLSAMLEKLQAIGRRHDLIIANFGHMGDGNIHISFQGRRADRSDADCEKVRNEIFAATIALEGRIAAEHGVGLDKRDHIGWNLDRPTLDFMAKLKQTLDPLNILNPGKVFP